MFQSYKKPCLFVIIFLSIGKCIPVCSATFDMLKLSNVPFPSSSVEPVYFNASYDKNITEYTICYRFLIESYNDEFAILVGVRRKGSIHRWMVLDRIGWNTGNEMDGYQGGVLMIGRNVQGGGLGPDNYPKYLYYMLARNIDPAKWQNICYSYSTSLQMVHMYQNGVKVFGFHYDDEKDDPLPSTLFEKVFLLRNFRGMFTDLQILDTFSNGEKLKDLSTQCDRRRGEIFSWEREKLKTVRISLNQFKQEETELCQTQSLVGFA